eukprot:1418678-Karenia_brevis.AAC.1
MHGEVRPCGRQQEGRSSPSTELCNFNVAKTVDSIIQTLRSEQTMHLAMEERLDKEDKEQH